MKGRKRRGVKTPLRQWDVSPVRVSGRPGWRLRRKALESYMEPGRGPMVDVATVAGWRADVALPLLADGIERNGHRPSTIANRRNPYLIREEEGYRLALAFRLLRRTDSVRQAQRIVRAARGMEAEEAYLWYSYLIRASQNGGEGKLSHALALLGDTVW
jgi:hypothetical protein